MRGVPDKGIHIAPLTDDQLARVIEGPARIAGIELEPGLVHTMVKDVGAATALPFLAFVLRQLWERHGDAKRFNLQDYAALRGLKGAIGKVAEAVYKEAVQSEQQADALRRVFLSMVQVSEEDQLIRRPVTLARIPPDLQETIERFVRGRLLVTSGVEQGEPVVEVAHEAVLTGCPRLADWIKEVRADLRLLRQVRLAAAEWEQNANAEEFLWSEKRLIAVYDMIDRLEPELSGVERRFAGLVDGDDLWAEVENLDTKHHRRAQIGDRLARTGDARPGIGLRADGLPDFVWCDVPRGQIEIDGRAFAVEPFQISKYPVTCAQYSAFLQAADGFQNPRWLVDLAEHEEHEGGRRREVRNHPADNVSWYDAVAFCRWLSARLGFEVRLPTEWEWQQAATGGEPENRYPWGPEWDARRANTLDNDLQRTTAVGMYPHGASPVGAMDMSGNVYEWCLNQHKRPEQIGTEHFEPKEVRGGSWHWDHDKASATVRDCDTPDVRITDHGFRIIRVRPK
ncbi:MAG TPA: SUMF1/EgtB/PvdO family nonheme iron enzyme, partial [Thermoanaerobaculia bacterium]|nr:SUMF1/EgtB/PvdO family nonheme iron enzyme [Thermoanaerobaculia bacterium]